MGSSFESESSFFVIIAHTTSCQSVVIREELIKAAVKKNGRDRDETDQNLLFPPSIIQNVLTRKRVADVLSCQCAICCSVKGRNVLTDNQLIDVVTAEEGREQRQLFAVLAFMAAGFAARYLCSFHTLGWDDDAQRNSMNLDIFDPLRSALISDPFKRVVRSSITLAQLTGLFHTTFPKAQKLFNCPSIKLNNTKTILSGENLPFINNQPLNGDKSTFGSLYSFEIHREFRDIDVPAKAVRKELQNNAIAEEEKRTLEFLARCARPNFIQLLFWYQYDDKLNYVFPEYPGSLQGVLEGKLEGQITPPEVFKYGSRLKHWLWQGMVDIIQALKFFHFPEQNILDGELIAAHFDMKPPNILVNSSGTLIITDFGQARIRQFNMGGGTALTAQVGDPNYRPPLTQEMLMKSAQATEPKWSRAYDVWSMACIMTEIIEYILHGPNGYNYFRSRRVAEEKSSAAFWKILKNGTFALRTSVQDTLNGFRAFNDRYLSMVTDLLETMFSMNAFLRPTMSDCLTILSENIPADEWPLREDDELSISGPGTNPQLRNMHTQFKRNSEQKGQRCKMYLLSSNITKRTRLALEFKKEFTDDPAQKEITCVLSDSARYKEEEYIPLTLFDASYAPVIGKPYSFAFGIIHPNLTFTFDDELRAPNNYYHFLTAATRQRCLRSHIFMPISRCTVKLAKLKNDQRKYEDGHIQVWRQLLNSEFENEFTYNVPDRGPVEQRQLVHKTRQDSTYSQHSRTTMGWKRESVSSGSSGSAFLSESDVQTDRLVIFISGPPSRCLTINLTNRYNKIHRGLNAKKIESPRCVTFTAHLSNFNIGNLGDDKRCPGIPLDPEDLEAKENTHVDWVEIEFKSDISMERFENLWNDLFPKPYNSL